MSYPPSGQPPYGAPPPPGYGGYGYGPSDEKNSLGVWALVLGILGLCCGPIGIAAIFLGRSSRQAATEGRATNGTLGTVGMALGVVAVVLWVGGFLLQAAGVLDFPETF